MSSQSAFASEITLRLEVGWDNVYRAGPAWTPVRVTLTNASAVPVAGTVQVPDAAQFSSTRQPRAFSSRYEAPVVLLGGATKQLTLYVPGADVLGQIQAIFRQGGETLASATVYPTPLADEDLSVGVLTDDPAGLSWLKSLALPGASIHALHLSPSTFDATPQALASFDEIVLANVDTSSLDNAQLLALDRYVRSGGSLLLVGGPNAVETIRPLPSSLVPGRIHGARTLPDLQGLRPFGGGAAPTGPATVSVMTPGSGAVWATEHGVPLVVRAAHGNGVVQYLAFDPGLATWQAAPRGPSLLGRLILGAAPNAMRRLSLPKDYRTMSLLDPGMATVSIGASTSMLARASAVVLIILIGLVALYVVLLGPVGLAVWSRLRKPEWRWLALPVTALLFTGGFRLAAGSYHSPTTLINSVGMVEMDGSGPQYPAHLYAGLLPPASGTYRMTYGGLALAEPLGPYSPSFASVPSHLPLGWNLREGARTQVDFVGLRSHEVRTVALQASVSIPGTIRAAVSLSPSGDIVGTVYNGTGLRLLRPAMIAGNVAKRLSDLPPGGSERVRLTPSADVSNKQYTPMLFKVYGQAPLQDSGAASAGGLTSRIQEAVTMLPETNVVSSLGEVTFVAWTAQSLGQMTVAGTDDQQQSLTLLVKPVSVAFQSGRLTLFPGTLGASFVDEVPAQPRYPCCGPSVPAIYLGQGGSATFEFDVPNPGRTRFRTLTLSVYGGGADASYTGYTQVPPGAAHVYDWRTRSWVTMGFSGDESHLSRPDRFISPTGAILLKLETHSHSTELTIADPHHDLQMSGTLTVGRRLA